jgi:L-cysteate sulfo-lyase
MTATGRIQFKIQEVRKRLERLPRAHLAHLPTPLDVCRNLSRALGGPAVFIKRDDCTGLALGGNKTRELEYVLGDALAQGADCIIHGAASQSNQSRQIAAAAAKLGIKAYLTPKRDERSSPIQGNYLLDHLLGAEIHPVDPDSVMREAKERLAQKLRAEGRRPYIVGMGTTRPLVLAAVAYVAAFLEIVDQMPDEGVPDWIYTSSQGSTQAGLILGARLLGDDTKVVGVSATPPEHESYVPPAGIATLAQEAARTLGYDTRVTASDIEHTCDYVGEGYGVPTEASKHMIRLLARYEGILLDPIYTGKAFAALVGDIKRGRLTAGERVVFVHTGGLPLLFSYAQELAYD